jgi:micrococcal nuclease
VKIQKENHIIFAVIFGSCIIGVFLYSAITEKTILQSAGQLVPVKQDSVASKNATCSAQDSVIVTKVIDGDTLVVEGGSHIRLLGIDADEKNYPCYNAAKIRLEALVLNKKVVLEKDQTDTDQYGRCLRTLFLNGENINKKLVKEGLVVARFYDPDIAHKDEISLAEHQVIENMIGCKWNNVK